MDQENFTLEDLLDEDEIIQECRALNSRLVNFLKERTQIEQLLRYIVEEAPEDAEKGRTFKFPFIACEIFTCEVDIILKTLVEDEELMNLLFSFLEPEHPHSTLLAGYFSKVVVCLLLRKSSSLMNYIQAHPEIIQKLVDLVGITSIMEVLIRLIGADENLYTSFADSTQWLQDIDVLEMIVNKFSSSDCPQVHGNAAESLCAICRYAPPGLAAKISSPSFIARLFHHALGELRPRAVLVNALSVCICLLDPNRQPSGTPYIYNRQLTTVTTNPEIVEAMLESLGNLSKLLDLSSDENPLPTPYGKLQPPLGKHRLKIVEFISVLMTVKSEAAEKELIRLGVLKRILELFFEYPYNNFLHHHAELIIVSCLESKNASLVEYILEDCNLVKNIIDADTNTDRNNATPTVLSEGRVPPRIGNVGHMTRIANKLIQLGADNTYIHSHLQDNNAWVEWHENVLVSRNALENVLQWTCGRPTPLHDPGRYSDDDDYPDKDYDVATITNNLSQAFGYGFYDNADNNQVHGSLEGDDEDVYFDDESEVVISSLQLGDDQESDSLFTNPNWLTVDEEKVATEPPTDAAASPPPNTASAPGGVTPENHDDLSVTTTSSRSVETDKPPEQVDRKDSGEPGGTSTDPAGKPQPPPDSKPEPPKPESDRGNEKMEASSSSTGGVAAEGGGPGGGPAKLETKRDNEEEK